MRKAGDQELLSVATRYAPHRTIAYRDGTLPVVGRIEEANPG
jgi:hypothetical protein